MISFIVWLVFGEINVLIFGEGSGVYLFVIIVLVCIDDYSDVGSMINFKIGVDFVLVVWLKLCGNWGRLF